MTVKNSRITFLMLIFFIVCSFLLSSLFTYYQSKKSIREEILHSTLPLLSENIYSKLRHDLSVPINVSSSMSRDSFLIDWVLDGENGVENIQQYLSNIKDRYNFFTAFFVSSRSRNYYYYDGILKQVDPYNSHDIWYYDFVYGKKEVDLDVDTDEASNGVLTIFVNYRLEDFSGNLLGVVGVGIRLDQIAEKLAQKKHQSDRDVYLVDEDGILQVHSDMSLIEQVNVFNQEGISLVAEDLMGTGDEPFETMYKLNNDRVLISSKFIPEIGWHVFVEQSEKVSSLSARRSLFINLLVTAVIAVLMVCMSYIFFRTYEQQMESIAGTDNLTKAANRRELEKRFRLLKYRHSRFQSNLSLILIDLDNFKMVNDNYGHIAGDTVLKKVSAVLQSSIRPVDLLARWGGDEFVILLEAPQEEALLKTEAMLSSCIDITLDQVSVKDLKISFSAGVSVYEEGDSLKQMIDRADKALFKSKAKGKNCVTLSQ